MKVIDLTLPQPGSSTARTVLSRSLARLLGDLRAIFARAADNHAIRADVAALGGAVAQMTDRAGALSSVIRRPNVGALIRCARTEASVELVAELIATLAVELAVTGALPRPIELRCAPERVVSLAGRKVVPVNGGHLVVQPPFANARTPFHSIVNDLVLACEDNNPLAMYEAHPGKSGNAIDLGDRSADEWCSSLRDALERIERYLPDLRTEIDAFIHQFVPVGYDREKHLSASYREAIGTIYLTLHPDAMTMTEAIIHEFSHNKLNALFEVDEVLRNAYEPLYQSPVRPDPRPLHGVLLAVHAFIPVARLYELMAGADDPLSRAPSFGRRYEQIVVGNHEGVEILANAQPTDTGRAVLDELARWDRHFASRP